MLSEMSPRPSKAALARVSTKNPTTTSNKCPKFSHNCLTEKNKVGETTTVVSAPTTLVIPFIVDLEPRLDFAPEFDHYVVDLP